MTTKISCSKLRHFKCLRLVSRHFSLINKKFSVKTIISKRTLNPWIRSIKDQEVTILVLLNAILYSRKVRLCQDFSTTTAMIFLRSLIYFRSVMRLPPKTYNIFLSLKWTTPFKCKTKTQLLIIMLTQVMKQFKISLSTKMTCL
jgi:hypothetical protein